jgi:Protein of unknown function (DUF3053)
MLRAAGVIVVAVLLAGCGNDEPAQRKAFITFLQTRIIDKPGMHVPHLTADEAKSFGPYAKDYAVITDFNDGLDATVAKPTQEAIARGAVRSLDDVVSRHADFIAVRDSVAKLNDAIQKQLASADAAHAALKQPDDLKPVFDKAYERDVTIPAKAFAEIFPDLQQVLAAIIDLGDFIDHHKDKVKIAGMMVQTSDPTLQPELAALIAAVTAKSDAINKAQQRLQTIATGG